MLKIFGRLPGQGIAAVGLFKHRGKAAAAGGAGVDHRAGGFGGQGGQHPAVPAADLHMHTAPVQGGGKDEPAGLTQADDPSHGAGAARKADLDAGPAQAGGLPRTAGPVWCSAQASRCGTKRTAGKPAPRPGRRTEKLPNSVPPFGGAGYCAGSRTRIFSPAEKHLSAPMIPPPGRVFHRRGAGCGKRAQKIRALPQGARGSFGRIQRAG